MTAILDMEKIRAMVDPDQDPSRFSYRTWQAAARLILQAHDELQADARAKAVGEGPHVVGVDRAKDTDYTGYAVMDGEGKIIETGDDSGEKA